MISEIQKLQSTLDTMVAHHREEELMMEKSIEVKYLLARSSRSRWFHLPIILCNQMDKDRLEVVSSTLRKNRQDLESLDSAESFLMESPLVMAK